MTGACPWSPLRELGAGCSHTAGPAEAAAPFHSGLVGAGASWPPSGRKAPIGVTQCPFTRQGKAVVAHGTAWAGRAEACRDPGLPASALQLEATSPHTHTPPRQNKMPAPSQESADGPGSGPRGKLCGKAWPLPFPADTTFPVSLASVFLSPCTVPRVAGGRLESAPR